MIAGRHRLVLVATVLLVLLLAIFAAASPARAHGASRGLHLHLAPDPAKAGTTVRVTVDAAEPLVSARVGWAGAEPRELAPRRPRRHLEVDLVVPAGSTGTVSLQAEAKTREGRTVRAAAVLRVSSVSSMKRSPS